MSAADTLRQLRAEGFTVSTKDGRLFLGPRDRITDDIREEVRYFRAGMIEVLESEARGEPDSRVRCVDCLHYNAAAQLCINHRRALLTVPIIGPALASLRQHCPGYARAEQAAAEGQPASVPMPGPHQPAESPASGPPAAQTGLADAAAIDAVGSQGGEEGAHTDRVALPATNQPASTRPAGDTDSRPPTDPRQGASRCTGTPDA